MRTPRAGHLLAALCVAVPLAGGFFPADPASAYPSNGWGVPRDPRRAPDDPGGGPNGRPPYGEECDDEGNCVCIDEIAITVPGADAGSESESGECEQE